MPLPFLVLSNRWRPNDDLEQFVGIDRVWMACSPSNIEEETEI